MAARPGGQMAATRAPNIVVAISRAGAAVRADVPPELLSRYYVDGRGGPGLGFYPDRTTYRPVIRDYGRALQTDREDRQTSADMVAIALRRRWTTIEVQGDPGFRRDVWLSASAKGLLVRGYEPSMRDQEALKGMAEQVRRPSQPDSEAQREGRVPGHAVHEQAQTSWSPLRAIETLAAARVASPEIRQRLMAQAQARFHQLRTQDGPGDPLQAPLSVERLRRSQDRQR